MIKLTSRHIALLRAIRDGKAGDGLPKGIGAVTLDDLYFDHLVRWEPSGRILNAAGREALEEAERNA